MTAFYLFFVFSVALLLILFAWSYIRLKKVTNAQNKALTSSRRIYQLILEDIEFENVVQKIADSIPNELKFGTGVVGILDEKKKTIRRVAASRTHEAISAIKALSVPFGKIEVSLDDPNNLMARALREHKSFITTDVYDVLGPVLPREEAKIIQHIMGTKTTLVYPIFLKEKPIGVFIASTKKSKDQLSEYELHIIDDFTNLVGLVLQNSKLFTTLKETKEDLSRVNTALQEANEKLKGLDKLKDDFVSIASHELRTPMTAIRSYAWLAANRPDTPLSEKMKKYLSRILISTERLINLVNDMLNISRIESGSIEILPKVFDIRVLMVDAVAEIEPKATEKGLKVKCLSENIPQVFADPDKVHQVFLNLLGNALKFTPPNGNVTVSFFSDGKTVETTVKDSGVGISKGDLSGLFKKFGRLDNSYVMAATTGGTGLGLFICKNLVELMGGKINASSAGLGKGTSFTFSLPVATSEVLTNAAKYSNKVVGEAKLLEPVAV